MPRLHVNIDHVATLRQARRESFPDPVLWAAAAETAGAHGITCHLRKDRRHVQDHDVRALRERVRTFLNLECSLDAEMLDLAEASHADGYCVVPENRQEVTTEGGLDVLAERGRLADAIPRLAADGALVSLFVDPDLNQLDAARALGAPFVELHTGSYAHALPGAPRDAEFARLERAAVHAANIGLRVNAGHGLDYDNVTLVAGIAPIEELNIGFAIVARAVFDGVESAVLRMLALLADARIVR